MGYVLPHDLCRQKMRFLRVQVESHHLPLSVPLFLVTQLLPSGLFPQCGITGGNRMEEHWIELSPKQHTLSNPRHIHIPIPEFWNVECGIVLLRISHSNHAALKCIGMWNVECEIPHSNSYSIILECGMWNCLFENVSFLILLKCIGMWNVECGNPHSNSHSIILECGMWNCSNSHSRILQCGMWNGFPHSTFHIPMHFSRVRNETFSKR